MSTTLGALRLRVGAEPLTCSFSSARALGIGMCHVVRLQIVCMLGRLPAQAEKSSIASKAVLNDSLPGCLVSFVTPA
jgi:hypothetical protein